MRCNGNVKTIKENASKGRKANNAFMEGKREQELSAESEEKLFNELIEREKDVESILNEIENLIGSAADRVEAERVILEKYAGRIEEAERKASKVLEEWLTILRRKNADSGS
jgi:hypothetical protein